MIEKRTEHSQVVWVANRLNSAITESILLLRGQRLNGHHGVGERLSVTERANAVTACFKHRVVRGRHFSSDGPASGHVYRVPAIG